MMSDSPHTSAPMVMQGRALVLKNTCRNASSTSVKKHLSWSPDIHPTARWVPSTPHRSRPAGSPPTRQPGAVGAKERECNVGHYVEADDEEETRPSAAVPPSVRGSTRTPTVAIHDRGISTTSPSTVPAPRRRAAREARFPVGSARPLHRRAAAKMSHPHRPGGRPGRSCPAPVRSGRHRPARTRISSPYRNRILSREAPGKLHPPFRESQTGIFKASRGLF